MNSNQDEPVDSKLKTVLPLTLEVEGLRSELIEASACELAGLIRERRVSPVEVVEAFLGRIEQINPRLNAVVTLAPDALDLAREAEALAMKGNAIGPLHGVPVTVKDTIETRGLKTTSGSRLRASYLPISDAAAVARLKGAGAIIMGKTNVPEMAIPYECDNPVFGRTNNPIDTKLTSGGSSGGEAAAICARLSPAGLGSDLSGSIRVPAHFCGIAGLKPTVGRISSAGHLPAAQGALAHGAVIGPMARRVKDLSLLLEVLTEPGAKGRGRNDLRGRRVAVYLNQETMPVTEETAQTVMAAAAVLSDAGLTVIQEHPPCIERAIDLWGPLFSYPSLVQLKEFYEGHEEEGGPVVRALLASADNVSKPSQEAVTAAWGERAALREELSEWMKRTPFIIAPVGAVPAFGHGARRVEVNGEQRSVFRAFGYARAANVLGFPAVSVPAGRTIEGLPIGVQLIGRLFDEENLLDAASIIEESLGQQSRWQMLF